MEYLEAIKLADHVDGSLIELGFGKGHTLTKFISYMNNRDVIKRDIQLYDSFEGYASPVEEDENAFVKGGYKRPIQPAMDIRNTIKKDVKLIKGFVEDTLEESIQDVNKVAIVHSDLVSYSSTLYSLSMLHSKIPTDGLIIITGYSKYPGSKLALDNFIKQNKKEYSVLHSGDIAVVKKLEYTVVPSKVVKKRQPISW